MTPHGSASTYSNYNCRCVACTGAHAERLQKRRLKRRAWVAQNGLPTAVKHGHSAYTNWGCRCDVCRKANAVRARLQNASAK